MSSPPAAAPAVRIAQRRFPVPIALPLVALGLFLAPPAVAQPAPAPDAGRPPTHEDLVRMGTRLLDNEDLARQGAGLLDKKGKGKSAKGAGARRAAALDGGVATAGSEAPGTGGDDEAEASAGGGADRDREAGDAGVAVSDRDGGAAAAELDGGNAASVGDAGAGTGADGGASAAPGGGGVATNVATDAGNGAANAAGASPGEPSDDARQDTKPDGATLPGTPRACRIKDGRELPMKAVDDSPLEKLGVPPQAVPAVATVATCGVMALWPFLTKTLTGLFKSVVGARIKQRAKKGKKVDADARTFVLFGFRLRPVELASLLAAAALYGLAVSYAFLGWRLNRPFVVRQEALVISIYYVRSMVRFVYERVFRLTTQYKLWVGGAFLCLGSAYLGTTLGTVGFEVDGSTTKEDGQRIVTMKVWLIVLAVALAIVFWQVNLHAPSKFFQSGRVMMSGMALAEILPITPMPGRKIYDWRRGVWAALAVVVVPVFFAINFFL